MGKRTRKKAVELPFAVDDYHIEPGLAKKMLSPKDGSCKIVFPGYFYINCKDIDEANQKLKEFDEQVLEELINLAEAQNVDNR